MLNTPYSFDSLEKSWKHKVKHRVQEIAKSLAQQSKGAEEKEENEKEKFDFNDRKRKRKVVEVDEALEETHGGGADGQEENLAKISQLGKEAIMEKEKFDFNDRKRKRKVVEVDEALEETHGGGADGQEENLAKISQLGKEVKMVLLHFCTMYFSEAFDSLEKSWKHKVKHRVQEIAKSLAQQSKGAEEKEENEKESHEFSIFSKDVEIDDNTQQMTIEEAFADDDVVQEFRQDKEEAAKDSKGGDIDLSLPGWGAWGGAGISKEASKRKRRRFMIKGAQLPRKLVFYVPF
ncbi:U3 small nucleolar RNA-associated protein 14 homolog C-like [Diaphorina citri]|uniref:U3 small nucleolar RNA-associated protein 14 homolog C-like n=1 Tax=Diaphorina citri TaxID=121845 RepID=A0A1S4E812_DIACI|nr:U3 small nucleolar RNA-associated protein 14 homolog C-like [Diaphorina citri]